VGLRARRIRGVSTGIVLGAALVLALAALARAGVQSSASWTPRHGLPFSEPRRIVSSQGVLTAKLVASERQVRVSGDTVRARVYNDAFTGPTLEVHPGDTMRVTLVNHLSQPTNLHVHGLHVSPSGLADNVFREVKPGGTAHYVIHLPADSASGLYWYHSHMHHLSERQVFGGLSGMIVVDGIRRFLPPALKSIGERDFALRDLQVANGEVKRGSINPDAPTTRVVNNLVDPTLSMRPGQTQLWRFANVGADVFYKLTLGGHVFHVVAEDGRPVWKVWSAQTLVLPPGKRFEVLVQASRRGTYRLKTLRYNGGAGFATFPERTLATLTVKGTPVHPNTLPTAFGPKEDLSTEHVDRSRKEVFSTPLFGPFTINGKAFNPNRIDVQAELGTMEQWTLVNASPMVHPFHIHTNYFQVMSVGGRPYHAKGRQDTVILPTNTTVVVRIEFEDFVGKTVFHCHILNHEDRGMMAVIKISR
jgi:suppressor of ftsI